LAQSAQARGVRGSQEGNAQARGIATQKGVTHVETIGIKLLLMFVGAFILGFVLGYEYALASGGNGCAE
jgi:hypothetical protein